GHAHYQGPRRRSQQEPHAEGRDVREGRHRDRRDARPGPALERHPPGAEPALRPRPEGQGRVRAPAGQGGERRRRCRRNPARRRTPGSSRHDRQHPAQAHRQMIGRLVAFALHQRFIVLALALLLTVGGILAYQRLPIEAYPDVGDVQVEIITLWPGHSAEEVERVVTLALEKQLNGIPNLTFLRSQSLFGLSNIRVLFSDGTDPYWARQQVQERLVAA